MKDFAVEIRRHRERLMMTQLEVSEAVGISFGAYQRYEHGKTSPERIGLRTGLALCAILRMDPYDVVFGKDRETYLSETQNP